MDVPYSSLFRRSLCVVGVVGESGLIGAAVGDSGLIGAACEGGLMDAASLEMGCVAGAATDCVIGPLESVLTVLAFLSISLEGVLVRQGYERRGLLVWKGLGNVRRKAGRTRHYG